MGKVVFIFSFIAIFIACLWLFGMTSLISLKREKEMSIRIEGEMMNLERLEST